MIRLQIALPNEMTYTASCDRYPCQIGRSRKNDIILRHISVSGEHATIYVKNDAVYIRDLGSRNGIRVDGHLEEEVLLSEGMELMLGDVPCKVLQVTNPIRALEIEKPPRTYAPAPSSVPVFSLEESDETIEEENEEYPFPEPMPGALLVGALYLAILILQISEGSLSLGGWVSFDLSWIAFSIPITVAIFVFSKFFFRDFVSKPALLSALYASLLIVGITQLQDLLIFRMSAHSLAPGTLYTAQLVLECLTLGFAVWIFIRAFRPNTTRKTIRVFCLLLIIGFTAHHLSEPSRREKAVFQSGLPTSLDGKPQNVESFARQTSQLFSRGN